MAEEIKNAETPDPESTADQTQKLSEDANGLGPGQAGPFRIGLVDMIVGNGGVEVPGFVATKNEIFQLVRYWPRKLSSPCLLRVFARVVHDDSRTRHARFGSDGPSRHCWSDPKKRPLRSPN